MPAPQSPWRAGCGTVTAGHGGGGTIRDRIVAAGAGRISFLEAGSGPALVFLHALGGGAPAWDVQLAAFAATHRAISWDMPGYGRSDVPREPAPTAARYAVALGHFLDALGIACATVVGHSVGGLVAASFARQQPRRVRRLVLVSPEPGYGRLTAAQQRIRVRQRLAILRQYGPAGLAQRRVGSLLSPAAPALVRHKLIQVMSAVRPEGYRRVIAMMTQADILADLPPAMPTMLAWGTRDRVSPPDVCGRVAAAIPGCRVHTIAGVGHACYEEDPDGFNAALRRFLEEDT